MEEEEEEEEEDNKHNGDVTNNTCDDANDNSVGLITLCFVPVLRRLPFL